MNRYPYSVSYCTYKIGCDGTPGCTWFLHTEKDATSSHGYCMMRRPVGRRRTAKAYCHKSAGTHQCKHVMSSRSRRFKIAGFSRNRLTTSKSPLRPARWIGCVEFPAPISETLYMHVHTQASTNQECRVRYVIVYACIQKGQKVLRRCMSRVLCGRFSKSRTTLFFLRFHNIHPYTIKTR